MTRTEEGSLRQQLRPFHWRSGRWNEPGVQAPAGRGAWAPQAAHATAEGAAQRSQSVSFSCRQLPGRESAPPNTQLSPAPWRAPSGVSLPRISGRPSGIGGTEIAMSGQREACPEVLEPHSQQ